MPVVRACLGLSGRSCGVLIPASARRCPEHAEAYEHAHDAQRRARGDARSWTWAKFSRRTLRAWRLVNGPWCPGYGSEHDAHPSFDLTVDHIVPVSRGGAEYDPANTRVLCRSFNSSLGGRLHGRVPGGTHR